MENNPELERAERELEKKLHEERIRKNITREKDSLSDYLLGFAALAYFIHAIATPIIFICILVCMSDGSKIPRISLWLIFPSGLVSLGTAIGLFRVLNLPKPQTEVRKYEE